MPARYAHSGSDTLFDTDDLSKKSLAWWNDYCDVTQWHTKNVSERQYVTNKSLNSCDSGCAAASICQLPDLYLPHCFRKYFLIGHCVIKIKFQPEMPPELHCLFR